MFQIETHLVAKDRPRADACPFNAIVAFVKDALQKVKILAHAALMGRSRRREKARQGAIIWQRCGLRRPSRMW